jgi:hypothetical protein
MSDFGASFERCDGRAVTMLQARAIVKNIGVGSGTALRGANLSSPGA